jgi:hypothetical protein
LLVKFVMLTQMTCGMGMLVVAEQLCGQVAVLASLECWAGQSGVLLLSGLAGRLPAGPLIRLAFDVWLGHWLVALSMHHLA